MEKTTGPFRGVYTITENHMEKVMENWKLGGYRDLSHSLNSLRGLSRGSYRGIYIGE